MLPKSLVLNRKRERLERVLLLAVAPGVVGRAAAEALLVVLLERH